jgi:hypothetical protein
VVIGEATPQKREAIGQIPTVELGNHDATPVSPAEIKDPISKNRIHFYHFGSISLDIDCCSVYKLANHRLSNDRSISDQ